jgi:Flp pilus assembly pilin Flp
MLNLMKQFVREDDGLEMVEWAIVAALITTAAAVTMASIGTQVDAAFQTILGTLQAG